MASETLTDYEDAAVTSAEALREVYGQPMPAAVEKVTNRIDDLTARFVAACSLVLLGSHSPDGRVDVTPRGGPPGFVSVLGEGLLAMPDAPGNRRLDTLQNVIRTGRIGALFLIPGRSDTVRINGRALVTTDPDLLGRIGAVEKPPKAALLIEPDEIFVHCPRSLRFSNAWKPDEWLGPDAAPSLTELYKNHADKQ